MATTFELINETKEMISREVCKDIREKLHLVIAEALAPVIDKLNANPSMQKDKWVTYKELAEISKYTKNSLYQLVAKGVLKKNDQGLISLDSLQAHRRKVEEGRSKGN